MSEVEKLRGLLREAIALFRANDLLITVEYFERELSQQAEPVCSCPSGDGSLTWPCPAHPAAEPAALAPDRVEQQPVAWRWLYSNGGTSPVYQDSGPDHDIEQAGLAAEFPRRVQRLFAAPVAQTELVEALHRVKLTDEEAKHHSVSAVAYWNNAVNACIAALAQPAKESE